MSQRKKPEFATCPVNGCKAKVQKPLVFCPPHFGRLPARMQQQVTEQVALDPYGYSTTLAIEAARTEIEQQESL